MATITYAAWLAAACTPPTETIMDSASSDNVTPAVAPDPIHINLAIGGAGTCGAAEAGAVVALLEAGYVVDNVAGTSAGSMLGAVVAARMDPNRIRDTTIGLNYPSFQQPANRITSWLVKIPVVGQWIAWSFLGGAYKLDNLRATCDAFLQPLGSLTWGEHQARVDRGEAASLNIVSLNLNEGERHVFPSAYADEHGIDASDRPISEAISTSVAMPTFFRPPRIKDAMGREWVYSDGGTIDDVPYDVAQQMNPALPTVAISVDQRRGFTPYPKWSWFLGVKLLLRLVGVAGGANEEAFMERPDVAARTITCPTLGIDGANFGLTGAQAGALFDAGKKTAQEWIARDVAARQAQVPGKHAAAPQRPTVEDGGLAA